MATISVRIDADDNELLRTYTQLKGLSLSQFMRDAAVQKIEDEIDLHLFTALAKQVHDTFTLHELQEQLGIYEV